MIDNGMLFTTGLVWQAKSNISFGKRPEIRIHTSIRIWI